MNRLLPCLLALALELVAARAAADSSSWSGSSGRLVARDFSSASEGAVSADDFALWAKRFDSATPRDATVSIRHDIEQDDWTWMTIRQGRRVDTFGRPGDLDFAWALAIVEEHFGTRATRSPEPPRLYTIQLFASRSAAAAERFSTRIEEREVAVEDSFFSSACHPCFVKATSVLEPQADGVHRVVAGLFDDREVARRSLAKLRRRYRIHGFVRIL